MVIYIYGTDSFKKDIHDVLDHSNIKFRLDDHGEIKDLKTLDELKDAIEDNPNNIYLIDDDKIIKKNSLNEKIKFLKPKDGIEQEYLLDHGIGDISVDSIDELSKHIIKKLEALIHDKESSEIQESIVEIVEDAYEKEENNTSEQFELDDELSSLLSHRDENNQEEDELLPKELSFEEDFGNIELIEEIIIPQEENSINEVNKEEVNQGVEMSLDEFSEFDTLNEADILAALDGIDENVVSSQSAQGSVSLDSTLQKKTETSDSLDLSSSNVDDIAKLISQLLNNKTLEITVKVKN